jgi:hypothetical protein
MSKTIKKLQVQYKPFTFTGNVPPTTGAPFQADSEPDSEFNFSSTIDIFYESQNQAFSLYYLVNNNIPVFADQAGSQDIPEGWYSDKKFPHNDIFNSKIYIRSNSKTGSRSANKWNLGNGYTLEKYKDKNNNHYVVKPSKLVYAECYFIPIDFKKFNNTSDLCNSIKNMKWEYKRVYILTQKAYTTGVAAQYTMQEIIEELINGRQDATYPQIAKTIDSGLPASNYPNSNEEFNTNSRLEPLSLVNNGVGLYSINVGNSPKSPIQNEFFGYDKRSNNSSSTNKIRWFTLDSQNNWVRISNQFKVSTMNSLDTPIKCKSIEVPTHSKSFQMISFDNPYSNVGKPSKSGFQDKMNINKRSEAEGLLCYYHGQSNATKTVYYIPKESNGSLDRTNTAADYSLDDLAKRNIWIFDDKKDLIKYYWTENAVFKRGIFKKHCIKEQNDYNYWIFNDGSNYPILWQGINNNNAYPLSCILTGTTTRSIKLKYLPNSNSNLLNFLVNKRCVEEKDFYYNSFYDLSFNDIVKNNIPIYESKKEAENNSINYAKEGPYSDKNTNGFYYLSLEKSFQWKGIAFGSINSASTKKSNINLNPFRQNFVQPRDNNNLNDENQFITNFGPKTYYAFWACDPVLEPNNLANLTSSNPKYKYKLYVIESGLIKNNELKDFVSKLSAQGKTFRAKSSCHCYTYKHTIKAENFSKVQAFLKDYYDEVILTSSLNDLGIKSGEKIYLFDGKKACKNNNKSDITYTFTIDIEKETGINTNVKRNDYLTQLSKPLLRTNPKLSTNIKLVTDSKGDIFAESISANNILNQEKYKRNQLDPAGKWDFDLSNFWNRTQTPYEMAYKVKRENSDYTILSDYSNQYETTYHYGTYYNKSKFYDEQFRIMAPIWLNTKIPKKFIVYRVDNPKTSVISNSESVSNAKINNILKNCSIVKSFDLTTDSKLGKYLDNYVNSQDFPNAPLNFQFEENTRSIFRGISVEKGGFSSKEEYMFDSIVKQDNTIIKENDLITNGFKRNKLVCSNLINLEFLFNDDYANEFEVNRYFGIFVDDVETGIGNIDTIRNGLIEFDQLNSYLKPEDSTYAIPPQTLFKNNPAFGYIKVNNNYYAIDNSSNYDERKSQLGVKADDREITNLLGINSKDEFAQIHPDKEGNGDFAQLQFTTIPANNDRFRVVKNKRQAYRLKIAKYVANTDITLSDAEGNSVKGGSSDNTISGMLNTIKNNVSGNFESSYNVSIEQKDNYQTLYIEEKNPSFKDRELEVSAPKGLYKLEKVYTNPDEYEGFFMYTSTLPKGTFNQTKISNNGSVNDVAIATANAINNEQYFKAIANKNTVYAISSAIGYNLNQRILLIYKNNKTSFINNDKLINTDIDVDKSVLNTWRVYKFIGGSRRNYSVTIDANYTGNVNVGDYLPTKNNDYNKVIDIVKDIKNPDSQNQRLILNKPNTLTQGEYKVYADSFVQIGVFSGYDVYDMNFDFYDTSNSELGDLKLETAENINTIYKPGNANLDDPNSRLNKNDILGKDYKLEPEEYFSGLLPLLKDEDTSAINSESIASEYDRLKENYLKENAVQSRVVPYINKWVLKNGTNVRDNPYYLNANSAFGETNFAPDIRKNGRSRLNYSHEWFYLVNWPNYLSYTDYNIGFNYVNFIKGVDLDKDMFKSTDFNYFDAYMIGDGYETKTSIDGTDEFDFFVKTNKHKKFTLIENGNNENFASTIFKGLKFIFKERGNNQNTISDNFIPNTSFNGYKFSIIADVKNSNTNSLDFEIIKNEKWNFIIFYININIDSSFIDDSINRKLLYELKNKIKEDSSTGNYEYADTGIDGALALADLSYDSNLDAYRVYGVKHKDGSEPNFKDQISINSENKFGTIQISDLFGGKKIYLDILDVENNNTILLNKKPYIKENNKEKPIQVQYISNSDFKNANYKYLQGGINAHELILNKLSAFNINNILTRDVKYTTIKTDGSKKDNEFKIEVDNGKEIVKEINLDVNVDKDRPQTYNINKQKIGYELVQNNSYYQFLVRHSGNYTVDFKPVVTFTDPYSHFKIAGKYYTTQFDIKEFKEKKYKHRLDDFYEIDKAKTYYENLNTLGICFNVGFVNDGGKHDAQWGIIPNHFYHKVNEVNPNGVIKLSNTSRYLPLYPLIGEVAIDKRDKSVFNSSWEDNYYIRSLNADSKEFVHGNLSTVEHKSYFASTLMKSAYAYTLTNFDQTFVQSQNELNQIRNEKSAQKDAVIFENKNQIIIDFYIDNAFIDMAKNNGISDVFKENIELKNSIRNKNTLDDDIRQYILNNLIGLYNEREVILYGLESNNVETGISQLDFNLLNINGYKQIQNYAISTHFNSNVNFRLIYNKRVGLNVSFKPIIKIMR